ncbi:aminomethyl-transferring glycine dehydrogenase subunit GcvPB [Candidatus Dependentiae bacterium]|nr:aminomethyl-transferring glycine dehydrogenase subunit GcvPB [Candidatus Dependentiae bacterium]
MSYNDSVFKLAGNINPELIFGKIIKNENKSEKELDISYKTKEDIRFSGKPECEVVRHFVKLSQKNYSVDTGFYPLGSCTMKYNPKINEKFASNPVFNIHPEELSKNNKLLKILYELQEYLKLLTGMQGITLQPAAGANGEYTGLRIIKEFFSFKKENRTKIIVPDSSHGTNPATAALLGYEIIEIKSGDNGLVDLNSLSEKMDEEVAALMLTNPNTLGLFETDILKISEIVHSKGGLLYYDGANMNAILCKCKPADMGFDVMHLNLHKSFSTPHGGGGPGAGPVGVVGKLVEFLPVPVVDYDKQSERYFLNYNYPCSIGKIHSYFGNINVLLKAYIYIKQLGIEGLNRVSDIAVLNANYLKEKLKKYYNLPFDRICKHEFVLNNEFQKKYGVKTLDIAKRLIDCGYHPPTIYFPLIVHEAIMIEPTETETKETLDAFIDTMIKIAEECRTNPDLLKNAPVNAPVRRLDETNAARNPFLKENFQI